MGRGIQILLLVVVSVLVVTGITHWYSMYWLPAEVGDIRDSGLYGDSFGALNTMFSGLAFIGLIVTLYIQQREIIRNDNIRIKEKFESRFFKLLELQAALTDSLIAHLSNSDKSKKWDLKRRECLDQVCITFREITFKKRFTNAAEFVEIYKQWELDSAHHYERYFENLNNVRKFILNSKISHKEKLFYIELLGLQLNESELMVFFYYFTLLKGERYQGGTAKSDGLDLISYLKPRYLPYLDHLLLYYSPEYLKAQNIDINK